MAAGEDGGEGHPLAADDHRAFERLVLAKIDMGLQRSGVHHALWPAATDQRAARGVSRVPVATQNASRLKRCQYRLIAVRG